MQDYFGALLRSSGLSGDREATPALEQAAVWSDPREENLKDMAIQTRAAPAQAPIPENHPAHAPHRSEAAQALDAEPPVVTSIVEKKQTDASATAVATPAPVPSANPARPSAAGDPAQRLIRAALQWVAQESPSARAALTQEPPAAPRETGSTPAVAHAPSVRSSAPDTPARRTPMAAQVRPPTEVSTAMTTPLTVPPATANAVVQTAQHMPSPPEPDERVEVSIGSIHLRVEAPARTAQAPPARAERAMPRVVRSGLSRRVLHRL